MNLTIQFTQSEEAALTSAARRAGLDSADLIRRMAIEHLYALSTDTGDTTGVDAKLRLWQQRDGTPLMADTPTQTLVERWSAEDQRMTAKEREEDERLWDDIEKGLTGDAGIRLKMSPA